MRADTKEGSPRPGYDIRMRRLCNPEKYLKGGDENLARSARCISADAADRHHSAILETLARRSAGDGIWEQAKAAATAKMINKILREHPLIAAEIGISPLLLELAF